MCKYQLLRVGTVPTTSHNTVGFHAFQLRNLNNFYTYYAAPNLGDEPLYFVNNCQLKRYPFLKGSYPRSSSPFHKTIFIIRRMISIIIFSFNIIKDHTNKNIDIITIHSPMYSLIAFWGWVTKKRVFISFHGEDFNRIRDSNIYRLFSFIYNGVFVISPSMLKRMKEIHSCPVYFIGNGVDLDSFYNLGLQRKKQIVFVASFKHVKRHDLMLEGFRQFIKNEKFKEYRLVLVGEGEKMDYYRAYVAKNSIPNIEFVGQKTSKELLNIYNESEIFCLTSDSEGFPKVVLEALACGCTVVSTKVGSVPTIFGEEYPYYINKSDVRSVTNSLSIAAEQGDKMKQYFDLVKNYSWESKVKRYEVIYKNDLCIA